jgi:enterochelin esterase-like enzyme
VVHVYTPSGDLPPSLPVAVLFDAQAWFAADIMATFDNLIADRVVPPFLVAMAGYPFGPTRVRGLTRPSIHHRYLVEELMPWLVREFHATTDPAQTVLIGQSLGGLAAIHAALREPARFRNVISSSASLWWPSGEAGELSGADVLAAAATASPVRFWLESGAFEYGLTPGNRELHTTLSGQGTEVTYREYQGGHDYTCWRGGIGDGLAALLDAEAG